jgi:hypothetical protein
LGHYLAVIVSDGLSCRDACYACLDGKENMKTQQITCDYCHKDITYTTNCEEWRTVVYSEPMNTHPGSDTVTAMAMYQEFDYQLHFCSNARCFIEWVKKEYGVK